MILKRCIRTNRWHAVSVSVARNNLGAGFGFEYDIRINSEPSNPTTAAYLTPEKARALAKVLVDAAKMVEKRVRKERK